MKLRHIVFLGMLLHLAVTAPGYMDENDRFFDADDKYQDSKLWQRSGKIEGDMVLTQEQYDYLYKGINHRNGLVDTSFRWPKKRIPFEFSNDFTEEEKYYIEKVLRQEYARTCVTVVPRTGEDDYVYITGKNTGCWSMIGRVGGMQELNLQRGEKGCIYYRTIVHEFMHAVGFYHQHAATERDHYVDIQWSNVQDGEKHNFLKYASNVVNNYDQPYDYNSVMHYDEYTFSRNGRKTIIPRKNVEIGVLPKLSTSDIAKINKMYGC